MFILVGHLSPPPYEPGNEARTACNWITPGSLRLHESVCPSSVHPQERGSVVACMSAVGLANLHTQEQCSDAKLYSTSNLFTIHHNVRPRLCVSHCQI